MEIKWHVVYTKPNCEKKITEILTRKKIENYCPLNRVSRSGTQSNKVYQVPLFSSYVFVKVSKLQYQQLRQVEGIINLLYWMGNPVIIKESEIDMVKFFLNEHVNVEVEKTGVGINDTLSIVNGSLKVQHEDVVSVRKKKSTIGLPTLGYKMVGEFETPNVNVKSFDNFISRSTSKFRVAVGMYF